MAASVGAARHAIVCLVMRGDAYVPGALVTAYSVRCAGTTAELVCMVTDDVSEAARTHLRTVFDRVVRVPYIRALALPLATAKQRDRYGAWMSVACTKWNLLALDEYEKVLFLDADKLVLSSLDSLFDLPAPAATFSSPWSGSYVPPKDGRTLADPYAGLRHGDRVPAEAVQAGLDNAFVAIGTCMLLRPSRADLAALRTLIGATDDEAAPQAGGAPAAPMADDAPRPLYHAALGAPEMDLRALLGKRKKNDHGDDEEELFSRPQSKRATVPASSDAAAGERAPFGYPRCNSGTDEQAICALYQDGHTAWTWIHPRHNYIPWLPRWIVDVDTPPTVFHFFNTKPWQMARDEWPDLEAWWRMAAAVVRRYPEVAGHFDAASVAIPASSPRCCWCADKGKELDRLRAARRGDAPPVRDLAHLIFDDDGRLACPALQPNAADHEDAAPTSSSLPLPASASAATALRWSEADEDDRASP